MKNYNYTKDTITRDIPTPVIMLCPYIKSGEKPWFLLPLNGDIWIVEHDEFFDSGLDENTTIIPVNSHSVPSRGQAYLAYEYFINGADSGEFGESLEHNEDKNRRTEFAILYEAVTGKKMVFKDREVW